jgi:hypothetical protein
MRGAGVTIEACDTTGDDQPRLRIAYDGPRERLFEAFRGPGDQGYTPTEIDCFYRLLASDHPTATSGKFGVADRASGAYLFETRVHPSVVEAVVRAVAASDQSPRYEVALRAAGREVAVFEKELHLSTTHRGRCCVSGV